MEAMYSSVPEIEDSFKDFMIFSATVILIGVIFWFVKKEIKKEKENENRNIRQG